MTETNNVNCDLFGISEDYTEQAKDKVLSLDRYLIKSPSSTFFFRMGGNSMAPYILEKDILLVDRALKPSTGQIIILEYQGNLICKALYLNQDHYRLQSFNKKIPEIKINRADDLHIWGTVIGQVRKFT